MNPTATNVAGLAIKAQANGEVCATYVVILELTPELQHNLKEVVFALQPLLAGNRLPVEIVDVGFRVSRVAKVFHYDEFVQEMERTYPGWSDDALRDGVPCCVPAAVVSALEECFEDDWVAHPWVRCEKLTVGFSANRAISVRWEGHGREFESHFSSEEFDYGKLLS